MPPDPVERQPLPDRSARDVPVWTIRPGTMARGWAARIQGPISALDLEVVPAIDLYEAYVATCDAIPLPFGAWMTQDGPTQTITDVRELRDGYDTVSESEHRLRAENERLRGLLGRAYRALGPEAHLDDTAREIKTAAFAGASDEEDQRG